MNDEEFKTSQKDIYRGDIKDFTNTKNSNMHSTLEPNKRTLNGDNNEAENTNRRMRSDLSKIRNQSNQRSRVGINVE